MIPLRESTDLYRRMLTIRLVEARLQEMCNRGEAGDLHFSSGEEGISVGVCAALQKTDYVCTHHRTIAKEIALGGELEPLIAEVLGKKTGMNGGRAGEMHLSNPATRLAFSFQLVATVIPVAAGLAYALKYHHKTNDIVAVFFGDAATSNGQFHEGCTIAALKKVPLLLICENNHLAGNITPEYYLPTKTVLERMSAYGIKGLRIDGHDVNQVRDWADKAAYMVRTTGQPYLLECDTTRLCHHKQGQGDVRTKDEMMELAKRDPLLLCEQTMGTAAPETRRRLTDEISAELDTVFARVAAAEPPEMNYA